ncbi:hypothetical protein [Lentzea sp.]|uniref:hypothetical protein n=1 Tax=Lentzea sp. TaxID=56099 RepID=UPI002C6A3609|nr:hypothetical protein [Lentzea sp.]HUQ58705.1 hypothetical protein [Lentzea sp.]
MSSVVAALLLVAVISVGATASADAPAARCAAAPAVVSGTETAVEARVLTGCTAGELVVFRAALVARVHGTSCAAVSSEIEADPAVAPQWVRTRLELVCGPGENGRLSSWVTVETQDSTYGLGTEVEDANPAARHLWTVELVAGLGELPEAPESAVRQSGGRSGSWVRADHEVYDG